MTSKLGIVCLCLIALCSLMPIDDTRKTDEAAIRRLVDGFVSAIRAKDVHRVVENERRSGVSPGKLTYGSVNC